MKTIVTSIGIGIGNQQHYRYYYRQCFNAEVLLLESIVEVLLLILAVLLTSCVAAFQKCLY